jgi:hypothetical protein
MHPGSPGGAGPYRASQSPAPGHPRAALQGGPCRQREAVYGRAIPGENCAAQLETVSRWYRTDIRDAARCWAVILGARHPSAIETATGAWRSDTDWNQRLAESLDWFDDLHFP